MSFFLFLLLNYLYPTNFLSDAHAPYISTNSLYLLFWFLQFFQYIETHGKIWRYQSPIRKIIWSFSLCVWATTLHMTFSGSLIYLKSLWFHFSLHLSGIPYVHMSGIFMIIIWRTCKLFAFTINCGKSSTEHRWMSICGLRCQRMWLISRHGTATAWGKFILDILSILPIYFHCSCTSL